MAVRLYNICPTNDRYI